MLFWNLDPKKHDCPYFDHSRKIVIYPVNLDDHRDELLSYQIHGSVTKFPVAWSLRPARLRDPPPLIGTFLLCTNTGLSTWLHQSGIEIGNLTQRPLRVQTKPYKKGARRRPLVPVLTAIR